MQVDQLAEGVWNSYFGGWSRWHDVDAAAREVSVGCGRKRGRTAAPPAPAPPGHAPPGLVHREEDQGSELSGEQGGGDGHGVHLVEVAEPHHDRGLEVRVLGLAALAGDPGLEVEVAAAAGSGGVAEGLGAPRTEPLAVHPAQKLGRPRSLRQHAGEDRPRSG